MDKSNQIYYQAINSFIQQYTELNINGVVINCPYWMNKLAAGKVIRRGFANGKGSANEIKNELINRLNKLSSDAGFELTPRNLRKFARRERIGIDCSGFVFRVLDELLHLGFGNTEIKNMDNIFDGGISKTNVKRLTSSQYSMEITDIRDFKVGDMIRLCGGRHAAIVIGVNQKEILYAHSSWLSTKIQGVHTSTIQISKENKSLGEQKWEEETRSGENFGIKRFNTEKGDGVFRLKIFQ